MKPFSIALVLVAALTLSSSAVATFPGANGRIAFMTEGDPTLVPPQNRIATVNRDGTDLRKFGTGHFPVWSADGQYLAFEERGEIRVMDANGSSTRAVGGPGRDPAWSPDGVHIAFTGIRGIEIVNTRTGASRLVAAGGTNSSWSPDGMHIVFLKYVDPVDLFIVRSDGSGMRNVTNSEHHGEQPPVDWSPDGRRILFFASGGAIGCKRGLETIEPDGSNRTALYETFCEGFPNEPQVIYATHLPTGELLLRFSDPQRGQFLPLVADGPSGQIYGFNPVWQPLPPPPHRGDFKNAAKFCTAEREYLGKDAFTQKYGGGANAHGKCVSGK